MNISRFNPLTIAEKITGRPMTAGTRHFLKDSFLYSLANLAPRALGLLILPLVAAFVPEAGYAIFLNYNSAVLVLVILVSAQVEVAVARYYYEEKHDFPEFLGSVLIFTGLLAGVMAVMVWLLRGFWANTLKVPEPVLLLALVTALSQVSYAIYLQLLLARKQSRSYFNINLGRQIVYVVAVPVLLWVIYKIGWDAQRRYLALVYANLLSTVPLGILFLVSLWRMMRPAFRRGDLAYALRLTLPGIAQALALAALGYFDRIFISHRSLDLAGQYGFAYQLGLMISMVTGGVFNAYMPRFYEHRNRGQFEEIQKQFRRNLKMLLAAAAALIILSGPVAHLLTFRNPKYLLSLPVVPIVVSGYLFTWLGQCYGLYMSFRRRFLLAQSMTLVIAAALNIGLNVWLLPIFNYNTKIAALNTLIPMVIQWLMVYAIARWGLRERTITLKGSALPLAAYLAFSALWCAFAY